MRYAMLTVLAAVLLAPVVGCESHSKDTTSHNPITGSTTHTHESGTDTTN